MGIVNKKCQNIGQILDIDKQFALPVKVVFTGKVVKWFYRFFTGKLPVKSPHYSLPSVTTTEPGLNT